MNFGQIAKAKLAVTLFGLSLFLFLSADSFGDWVDSNGDGTQWDSTLVPSGYNPVMDPDGYKAQLYFDGIRWSLDMHGRDTGADYGSVDGHYGNALAAAFAYDQGNWAAVYSGYLSLPMPPGGYVVNPGGGGGAPPSGALSSGSFSNSVTTSSFMAGSLSIIFYAVFPIALLVGLVLVGYRMSRKLAT